MVVHVDLTRVYLHDDCQILEQPEGIKIALIFIVAIVASSLFSRVWRSTELRVERIELDDKAREFIRKAAKGTVRIITNRCDRGDALEYEAKEKEKRTRQSHPRRRADSVLRGDAGRRVRIFRSAEDQGRKC